MEILIKKINRLFKVDPTAIVMGDARHWLVDGVIKQCEEIIDRYAGKHDRLWLLIHANPRPANRRIINTKIVVMNTPPPKMLGTVCIFVDYTKSDVDLAWALPLDIIKDPAVAGEENVERVAKDGADMPIIH